MAYMNQEKKAKVAALVKPILAKYGVKGSLSVRNHSTLVLTLTSGSIDFIGDMPDMSVQFGERTAVDKDALRARYSLDINPYWFHEHYTGTALAFLSEILPAMKGAEWYDRSDIMTDYFDTAYYVDVNVGKWDTPYTLTK